MAIDSSRGRGWLWFWRRSGSGDAAGVALGSGRCVSSYGVKRSGCRAWGGWATGLGLEESSERLLIGRKAGIDEAGKVLGNDLRGLQLLLDGIGFSAFDGFAGGNVLLVLGREAGLGVGDDEDFVKTVEMGVGLDDDVDEGVAIRIGNDFFNFADGQAAGKDEVAAGGEHLFAGLDALVLEDADDFKLAGGVAGEDAADARGFKNDAGAAGLVVDEQDLGGAGKDVADLADDAVGGR